MIATVLLSLPIAPAPPAADGHAALHPADVQVFVEAPDLEAARDAYAGAPLWKLLGDPDLAAAVAKLTGEEFEPVELFTGALEQAPLPEAVREAVLGAAGQLRSVSFSAGGLDRGPAPTDESPVGEAEESGGGSDGARLAAALSGLHARAYLEFESEETAAAMGALLAELGRDRGYEGTLEAGHGSVSVPEAPGTVVEYRVDGARLGVLWRALDAQTPALGDEVAPSLAQRDDVGRLRAATGGAKGAPVWGGFLAIDRAVWSALAERSGDDPPEDVDLMVRSWFVPDVPYAWRTTLESGVFHKRSSRASSGDVTAVDKSFLEALPAEAIGTWAWTFDADALFQLAMDLAVEETGSSFEDLMKAAEEASGLRPDRDLVPHLGSTLFVYLEPIRAIGPPKLRAYVELKDADAFAKSLATFAEWVGTSFPEDVVVKSRPYRGVPLSSFTFSATSEMGPVQPSPTLAVVEGRLLVSLNAVHAKREIKRLASVADEEPARHALLDHESLRTGDLLSIGHLDWRELVDGVYGLASTAAGLFGGMAGGELGIDFSALPPGEVLTRHLAAATSITTRSGAVDVTRGTSPFGPEAILLPLAAALPTAFAAGDGETIELGATVATGEASEAAATSDATGAEADAEEQKRELTRASLRAVRTGLAVYKMDRGELPAALTALTSPSDSFPDGYLGKRTELPRDGWGQPLVYFFEGDDVYYLYSAGPNGEDEGGGGDDVSAD